MLEVVEGSWLQQLETTIVQGDYTSDVDRFLCCLYTRGGQEGAGGTKGTKKGRKIGLESMKNAIVKEPAKGGMEKVGTEQKETEKEEKEELEQEEQEMLECVEITSELVEPSLDCSTDHVYDITLNIKALKEKKKT